MMRFLLCLLCWLAPFAAFGHEMRPAYLSLSEGVPGQFSVMWKVPAQGDRRLALDAELPDSCRPVAEPVEQTDGAAFIRRWMAECAEGLRGGEIRINGLSATMTDVLVRIAYANGATEITRLRPEAASFTVAGPQSAWAVALTYFRLGVEHILGGVDHLAFVLALILLIDNRWMLVKTITAFTIAHSITLAGAALGLFSLPQRPVEAVIALSIAFVARELVLQRQGETRLSARMPWLVAFSFGLLHGFGFAGALQETGLPQTDIPLALLTFNLGVEAGQLLFVAAVLALFLLARKLSLPLAGARRGMAFAIGTLAMFWLVTRLVAFGGAA